MHKRAGSAAGILALLTVLLHVQFAPPGEVPAGNEKASAAGNAVGGNKSAESKVIIEGPWLAIRDYFHAGDTCPEPDAQCPDSNAVAAYLEQMSPSAGSPVEADLRRFLGVDRASPGTEMWSIVATVPDPLHTRMTLTLDSEIEALERSLQAAGWDFAGQWMSWNDRFDGREKDIAERLRQRALQSSVEAMPGILIFRCRPEPLKKEGGGSHPRVLFVLLVPETATSGIAWRPFVSALNLASALTSPGNRIGLLAPSFSGSFASLGSLVNDWRQAHPAGSQLSGTVYSGSASGFSYAEAFEKTTQLGFHSGTLDTQHVYQRFCQAVLKDNDIDPHKAALLKEDETALSNSFTGCAGVPAYVFPRDISHLRNAYQETGAAGGAPADSARSLSFSIRDPASGEDSIPAYSEVQTPLSQDAIIDAIARELVERETRLVFIAASNPLDVMFLMRAIRQVAPDIRIITDDPQILMVPEASRDPLSGTVVLSTYPMFADGERWLDPSGDRLVFPDPWAQGTYNVAQFLLADLHALFDKQKLSGYSQFAGSSRYPGMWALSLTRSGFLPLAYYGGPWKSIDSQPEHRCGPAEDCGWMHAATPFVSTPPTIIPPRSWRLTVLFLGIAALLGSLRLVWCNISVKPRKPIWLAVTDGGAPRMLALIAAALALSAVQWVLLCPVLNLRLFSNPAFPAGGLAFGLLAAAGLLAPLPAVAFVVLRQARRYQPQVKERKRLPLRAVVYPAMVFGLFLWLVISWALLCYPIPAQHADSEHQVPDAFFLRFRAVDLYSGSSPAAPLMVLAVIFFLISIFYFKRYTTGGPNGPRFDFSIKSSDAGPVVEFRNRWVKAVGDIEECVLAPSLLSGPSAVWRAATGCLAAVFCLLVLNRYPAAFEHFTYNLTLWVLLSFVLFWLAIGCYDLWTLWKRVHKMLDLVELLRLQPALKRISQDWPRRPVWAFRQSVSKHLLDRQMIYALHGRVVTLKALQKSALELVRAAAVASQASVPSPAGTTSIVTTVQEAEKDVGDFTGAVYASLQEGMQQTVDGRPPTGAAAELARLRNYQQTAANIASRLLQSDLRPFWRQSLEQEDSQDLPDGRNKTETLYLRCCADFVALQCCRYAADKVEHVQRIASCISLTFVLLLVFFNAYSVEGPQAVARFLALLFLVIGYLIVRVLAAMERNPILSAISRTKSGELNVEFWVQLVSLGALPLIGVLAHLFPSMSRFLFQWVAPGVQAVH